MKLGCFVKKVENGGVFCKKVEMVFCKKVANGVGVFF